MPYYFSASTAPLSKKNTRPAGRRAGGVEIYRNDTPEEGNHLVTEFMALATVVILLAVTDTETAGAVFGSLAGFSVWLGVFAGYKLSRRINGPGSPFAYVYAIAITAVLRYAEIAFLLPPSGGPSPEADLARLVWPVVASLLVMALVNIALKLRVKRG